MSVIQQRAECTRSDILNPQAVEFIPRIEPVPDKRSFYHLI
jgi:hypothetical protein